MVTRDHALEAFKADAEELILRKGFKVSDLHKVLQKISRDATNDCLPPLEVLICDSYGLYRYSEDFVYFLAKEKAYIRDSLASLCAAKYVSSFDSNSECSGISLSKRVLDVKYIAPFGQFVMEQWPDIANMVKAYVWNDLGHRMGELETIVSSTNSLHRIRKVRAGVDAQRACRERTKKRNRKLSKKATVTKYDLRLLTKSHHFHLYTCSALKAMCTDFDAEERELTRVIQEKRDALLTQMTEAQYELMLQIANPPMKANSERTNMSFLEAIRVRGPRHPYVWACQRVFNESAMRFLRLHPEHIEIPPEIPEARPEEEGGDIMGCKRQRMDLDCTRELGLCAASHPYCKLQIVEVPSMTEWAVRREPSAKDFGLESIYFP